MNRKKGLIRHKGRFSLLMRVLRTTVFPLMVMALALAPVCAHAQITNTLGDYGNVTVIEYDGSFDALDASGNPNSAPRQEITKEFYRLHADEYDFIYIFSNFDYPMPNGHSDAFYTYIKNDTRGIGKPLMDHTASFGSGGRLQGMVDMGNLSALTTAQIDPEFESSLNIMMHEVMHRWSGSASHMTSTGEISYALTQSDGDHWSLAPHIPKQSTFQL